jgi:hypothetical protein
VCAELRKTAQTKYEQCMELPALSTRQPTPEQSAQVAALRTEVEDAHKVRARGACAAAARVWRLTPGRARPVAQLMQQLSTEKVRLAATAGDLVRRRAACRTPRARAAP